MKLKNLTKYILLTIAIFAVLYYAAINIFYGQKHSKTSFALNTYTTISAYGKNANQAVTDADKSVAYIESRLSAYVDASEVSALNNVQIKNSPIHISDELFYIIKAAGYYSQLSGGLFDITLKPVSDLWSISQNPRVPSEEEIKNALSYIGYKNIVLNETDKTITFLKDGMQIDLGAIAKGYAADKASEEIFKNGCQKALVDLGGNICI